jgi:hypothetical protein
MLARNGIARKTELVFDARRDRPDYGFVDATSQNGRHFNLDLRAFGLDEQLGDDLFAFSFETVHGLTAPPKASG